jgi:hypothetical protein
MNKIANIPLETTADYQSLSKLGVQFWNQDKNTAILQFKITRNDYPLALGEENVKVFIALESGDSFLVDDKIIYVDEMEGIVSYTIPTDFMRVASNVTGQVYVTTLDEEEVVVQRQFSFKVSNDLIADLPAEDKIREIKYFADMRAEVAQMIEKLNSDFENMNDYVTQVEGTTQAGIKELNNLITQKEKAYNDNHTAKMQELDEKGTTYSQQLDDDKQYMDEKFEAFKESVNGSGLVTTGESKDWQKYKLTVDDGSYQTIDIKGELSTYQNLAPGLYYTSNAPISGMGQSSTAGWTIVEQRQNYSNLKRITFRPYNSNQEFVMRYYNEWNDWENALANVETTSGSQAKANTAESNARQYTDAKFTKRSNVLFEGNANGVGTPINLSESLDNFIVLFIYGDFPGGEFTTLGNPQGTRNINLNLDNIVGLDATGTSTYECSLSKVNSQRLQINSDSSMNVIDGTSSGANANKFTIQKIVGVYK